jgi:hypothetical protein
MSLTKLSLAGNNLIIPGQGEFSDEKIATPVDSVSANVLEERGMFGVGM